jgi:hypothetical protein
MNPCQSGLNPADLRTTCTETNCRYSFAFRVRFAWTPLIQSLENLLSTNPECAVYKKQFLKSITNDIRQLCVQNSIQEWLGEVTPKILHSCWMLHF